MDSSRLRDTISQIQMEYLEMPGMKLTTQQACRLFNLPLDLCDGALDALVGQGFLARTADGAFLRRSQLVRGAA
jgi:hypothetical protein